MPRPVNRRFEKVYRYLLPLMEDEKLNSDYKFKIRLAELLLSMRCNMPEIAAKSLKEGAGKDLRSLVALNWLDHAMAKISKDVIKLEDQKNSALAEVSALQRKLTLLTETESEMKARERRELLEAAARRKEQTSE